MTSTERLRRALRSYAKRYAGVARAIARQCCLDRRPTELVLRDACVRRPLLRMVSLSRAMHPETHECALAS